MLWIIAVAAVWVVRSIYDDIRADPGKQTPPPGSNFDLTYHTEDDSGT